MKKIIGLLVFVAIAAFCFGTVPAIADEGIGEYASDAGSFGKGKTIPPGHYGIVAEAMMLRICMIQLMLKRLAAV